MTSRDGAGQPTAFKSACRSDLAAGVLAAKRRGRGVRILLVSTAMIAVGPRENGRSRAMIDACGQ